MRCFPLVLAALSLVPRAGLAQTQEKKIADFYWRTGHAGSALFYAQLDERRNGKKESPSEESGKKEPAKQAPTLEQLIAEALKNNPDIRVADAKLQEAEAEANRARLKVASDVAILHADIEAARAALNEAQMRFDTAQGLRASNAISKEDFIAAKLTYLKFKAELASAEAKLPLLLGRLPGGKASGKVEPRGGKMGSPPYITLPGPPIPPPPPLPFADKLRKALDAPMRLNFEDSELSTVLDFIRDKAFTGINLNVRESALRTGGGGMLMQPVEKTVTAKFDAPVPVGALLQFLEDEQKIVFILRDYGIVVVAVDEKLPPGALRMVDFWKQGKTEVKANEPKAKTPPTPPPPVK